MITVVFVEKLRDMLCDFKASTEAVGLGIHPDKTKILSNQDNVKEKEISVDNIQIEILRQGECSRYLGKKSRSRITKHKRSKTGWRQRGQRSTSTARSWPREITDCVTDFAFSIWSSLLANLCKWNVDSHAKNTKRWSRLRNERCFASEYWQEENTRQKRKLQAKKKRCPMWQKDNEIISEKKTEDESHDDSNKDQDRDVFPGRSWRRNWYHRKWGKSGRVHQKKVPKKLKNRWRKYKIPCWIEVHRRTKWRMARRIVSLPEKRWNRKFLIGIQDLIQLSAPKDQWVDQKEDGKTISTNLQKTEEDVCLFQQECKEDRS